MFFVDEVNLLSHTDLRVLVGTFEGGYVGMWVCGWVDRWVGTWVGGDIGERTNKEMPEIVYKYLLHFVHYFKFFLSPFLFLSSLHTK